MSDTYHEGVPVEWIHRIHNDAWLHPEATFLILTKRIERAYQLAGTLAWSKNLWIGTSVESAEYLWRLDYLLRIPAAGHFLSAGPLLGEIPKAALGRYLQPAVDEAVFRQDITRRAGLGWVIVEAESGSRRRRFDKAWACDIRDVCQLFDVPFMFKQGSANQTGQDRDLDGRTWSQSPFKVDAEDVRLGGAYWMLPEEHTLRRYFEERAPGAHWSRSVEVSQAALSVQYYADQLARVNREIEKVHASYPLKITAARRNLTAVALTVAQSGADIQGRVRVKHLGESLDKLRSDYRSKIRSAGVDQRRLRRELRAWEVRQTLVDAVASERKAA
jgi:protein gp37